MGGKSSIDAHFNAIPNLDYVQFHIVRGLQETAIVIFTTVMGIYGGFFEFLIIDEHFKKRVASKRAGALGCKLATLVHFSLVQNQWL